MMIMEEIGDIGKMLSLQESCLKCWTVLNMCNFRGNISSRNPACVRLTLEEVDALDNGYSYGIKFEVLDSNKNVEFHSKYPVS